MVNIQTYGRFRISSAHTLSDFATSFEQPNSEDLEKHNSYGHWDKRHETDPAATANRRGLGVSLPSIRSRLLFQPQKPRPLIATNLRQRIIRCQHLFVSKLDYFNIFIGSAESRWPITPSIVLINVKISHVQVAKQGIST